MSESRTFPPEWGKSGFIIAVPARNEAVRLPVALASLACDGVVRDVIVIANGCSDDTAAVARSFPAALRVAVLETGPLLGGVGEARRAGILAALDAAPCAAVLASTDADCLVTPGWGATTLAAIERVDAVCGRVIPEPEEFARLPDIVRRHGALEDRLDDLKAELEGLRTPAAYDPLPRHNQTPGASLAIRTHAYLHAGGFEPIPCHEDRRLVARIEAAGGRIARPWALAVTASCRLRGRAPGGMADTIAARSADPGFLHGEIARMQAEVAQLEASIAAYRRQELIAPCAPSGSSQYAAQSVVTSYCHAIDSQSEAAASRRTLCAADSPP